MTPPGPLDLVRGIVLPVRAAWLVGSTDRLRRLAFASALITFVALVIAVALTFVLGPALLSFVWVKPTSLAGRIGWDLALLPLGALIGVSLIMVLPSLSLNLLQDATVDAAAELSGAPGPARISAWRGLLRGLLGALARLALLWAGQALLLLLLLTPAAPAWPFLSAGWTAICLTAEQLAGAMGRFGHPFNETLRALWARPLLSLGMGLTLTALFWIPVVDLFFVPVAVVAGTLLYTGLLEGGSIAPPPRG